MTVDQEGHSVDANGVLDLESEKLNVFHFHESMGGEGPPPAPLWSPDGQWLNYHINETETLTYNLWVIRSDGSEEYNPGPFEYAVCSPDSRWLAVSGVTEAT